MGGTRLRRERDEDLRRVVGGEVEGDYIGFDRVLGELVVCAWKAGEEGGGGDAPAAVFPDSDEIGDGAKNDD